MWSFLQSGNMVAVKIILFLCFAFNLKLGLGLSYPMAMKYNEPSGWNKPKALCPYGPCEVIISVVLAYNWIITIVIKRFPNAVKVESLSRPTLTSILSIVRNEGASHA